MAPLPTNWLSQDFGTGHLIEAATVARTSRTGLADEQPWDIERDLRITVFDQLSILAVAGAFNVETVWRGFSQQGLLDELMQWSAESEEHKRRDQRRLLFESSMVQLRLSYLYGLVQVTEGALRVIDSKVNPDAKRSIPIRAILKRLKSTTSSNVIEDYEGCITALLDTRNGIHNNGLHLPYPGAHTGAINCHGVEYIFETGAPLKNANFERLGHLGSQMARLFSSLVTDRIIVSLGVIEDPAQTI